MSRSSEDAESSKRQRAAELMRGVRLRQARSRRKFRGQNYLSPDQRELIARAVSESDLVAAIKKSTQADLPVNYMVERFEEMCRRQAIAVDAELRPSVVELLAAELSVNHKALNAPAGQLISATIHQGAIGRSYTRSSSTSARRPIYSRTRQ